LRARVRRKTSSARPLRTTKSTRDFGCQWLRWAADSWLGEDFSFQDDPNARQMVPLAALPPSLDRSSTHHESGRKLRNGFWCGVLGELSGGTIETRFARDIEANPKWLEGFQTPERWIDGSFLSIAP